MIGEFVGAVFDSWVEKVGVVLTVLLFIERIPRVKKRLDEKPLIDRFVPLLWIIAVFCVVYGFYSAWGDRYRDAAEAHRQLNNLTKPNFITTWGDDKSPITGQPTEKGHENNTGILVLVRLENRGAPSITKNWQLRIDMPNDRPRYPNKVIPTFHHFTFYRDNGEEPLTVGGREDDIEEKTAEHAVPQGDARVGFVMYELPEVSYLRLREAGTKFTVSFYDVANIRYELTTTATGGEGSKGPIYIPGIPQ